MTFTRSTVLTFFVVLSGCTPTVPSDAGDVRLDQEAAADVARGDAGLDVLPTIDDAAGDTIDAAVIADTVGPADVGMFDQGRMDGTLVADASDVVDVTNMMDVPPDAGPYPAGPYGIAVGSTLRNMNWIGYTNLLGQVVSTQLPYAMTSLAQLRGSGRGYALVHMSEAY